MCVCVCVRVCVRVCVCVCAHIIMNGTSPPYCGLYRENGIAIPLSMHYALGSVTMAKALIYHIPYSVAYCTHTATAYFMLVTEPCSFWCSRGL